MTIALGVLSLDPENANGIRSPGWSVLTEAKRVDVSRFRRFFVLVPSSRLSEVSAVVKEAQRLHKLSGLLIRAEVESADWLISQFAKTDLRSFRNAIVHSDSRLPYRVLSAWRYGAQHQLIALASADKEALYIRDCSLRRYVIPKTRVPVLKKLEDSVFQDFSVAPNGEFLHWPQPDLHLDLSSLRAVVDPEEELQRLRERIQYSRKLGVAIRSLRIAVGISQSAVSGLSDREVRRLESGESSPRVATLEKLARAHGLELAAYLNRLANAIQKTSGRHAESV